MSAQDVTPQAPPRRKAADRQKSLDEESTPTRQINNGGDVNNCDEKQTVSVKERMEKFNRMASMEDELSPKQPKSAERSKVNKVREFVIWRFEELTRPLPGRNVEILINPANQIVYFSRQYCSIWQYLI